MIWMNISGYILVSSSAKAAARLRIFLALDSCDGIAENISSLGVARSHLPSKQLLPPAIRCRASPRLIVMPVVRCISSIVFAIAAFCLSDPWMNFRRIAGFCFRRRLVSSRLSRRLSGFVKSSIDRTPRGRRSALNVNGQINGTLRHNFPLR